MNDATDSADRVVWFLGGPHDGHGYIPTFPPAEGWLSPVTSYLGGTAIVVHVYRYDAARNAWRHVYAASPHEARLAFGDAPPTDPKQSSNERREKRTGQDRKA